MVEKLERVLLPASLNGMRHPLGERLLSASLLGSVECLGHTIPADIDGTIGRELFDRQRCRGGPAAEVLQLGVDSRKRLRELAKQHGPQSHQS